MTSYEFTDGRQPQSIRYLTRFAASDGGVGRRVVHSTPCEALVHADRELQGGAINHPARLYGTHADVRLRVDPPSESLEHPGRLELCVKDTGALRLETLVAYGELARAVINRLEMAAVGGEGAIEQLHRDFPRLFGRVYDPDVFAYAQLDQAHRNSVDIAYNGPEAEIENAEGRRVSARQHFREVVCLAESGGITLSAATKKVLANSLATEAEVRRAAKRHLDVNGLPSLSGYYETGIGTSAAWMILRAAAHQEICGQSEARVMRDGTVNRSRSFGKYITSLTQAGGW